MDRLRHDEPDQHCPHCGAWQTGGDRVALCPFCDGELPWAEPPGSHNSVLKGLLWLALAYRQWSLVVFAGAIIDLLSVGNSKSFLFGFTALFPFTLALGIAYRTRNATSRWIIAFLLLVDVGVVLAPAHQIFPCLNLFPEIPRTQNRIISWYILVTGALQFPWSRQACSRNRCGIARARRQAGAGDLDLCLRFRGLGPTGIGSYARCITTWTQEVPRGWNSWFGRADEREMSDPLVVATGLSSEPVSARTMREPAPVISRSNLAEGYNHASLPSAAED